jgi:hypothetical protein
MEVYAGEKAFNRFKNWLPEDTVTRSRSSSSASRARSRPRSAAASARST